MSQSGARRYRDKLLFALAYGAIIAALVFSYPPHDSTTTSSLAVVQGTER